MNKEFKALLEIFATKGLEEHSLNFFHVVKTLVGEIETLNARIEILEKSK